MAIPLGVAAALRQDSSIDHVVRFICALGVCVPTFVSGLLLIYVFYYLLGIAPDPTGRVDIFTSQPPPRHRLPADRFRCWPAMARAGARRFSSSCCRPSPWRCS